MLNVSIDIPLLCLLSQSFFYRGANFSNTYSVIGCSSRISHSAPVIESLNCPLILLVDVL